MSREQPVPKGRKEGHESNLRAQLEEAIRQRDHLASQLTIAEREATELRESVFELSLRLSESSGSNENGPTVFSLTHGYFYSQDDEQTLSHFSEREESLQSRTEVIDNEEVVSSFRAGGEYCEIGSTSPTSSVGSLQASMASEVKPLHIGESHVQANIQTLAQQELSPISSPNKARTSVLEELTTSSKLVLDAESENSLEKVIPSTSPPPLSSLSSGSTINPNMTAASSPIKSKGVVTGTGNVEQSEAASSIPTQEAKKTGQRLSERGIDTSAQRGSRPALGMTAELRGHQGAVYAVKFSHDGEWLCSGGFDSKVCLWDVKAQAESSQKLNGHTQPVSSVAIEADDCAVVTGSYDKSVRRWDVQTGAEMSRVAVNGMVQAVALGDDFNMTTADSTVGNTSSLAFIGSTDKSLIVADHRVGSIVATWPAPAPITSVYCYSEEEKGGRVFTSDASGCVLIWECRTGTVLSSYSLNDGGSSSSQEGKASSRRRGAHSSLHVSNLACAPLQTEAYEGARSEAPFAAAVCGDNSVRLLERWSDGLSDTFGSVRARHVLRGPQLRNWPIGAAWWRGLHHKPPRFLGGAKGGTQATGGLASTATGDLLKSTDSSDTRSGASSDTRVKQLPWSHALVLACGSADGKIHLYDASSLPKSPVVPQSADGAQVASDKLTSSQPPGLAASGTPVPVQVLPCRSPGDRTYCVDWHPHEPCLASGSADGIVRLWQPVARQVAKASNTRTSRPGPARR